MDTTPAPRIAFHCPKLWDELDGDGSVRHCSSCDLSVHDLSSMRAADARRFLEERKGQERTCVRFLATGDGRIVSTRPPGPLTRALRTLGRVRAAAAVWALFAPLLAALPGCGRPGEGSVLDRVPPEDDECSTSDRNGEAPDEARLPELELLGYVGH